MKGLLVAIGHGANVVSTALTAALFSLVIVAIFTAYMLITFDVTLRYAFNSPITGVSDITELLTVIIIFGGVALAIRERKHLSVDLVVSRLPPGMARWWRLVIDLLTIIICSLLIWSIAKHLAVIIKSGKASAVLSVPLFPFDLFMIFCLFVTIVELARHMIIRT